MPRSSSVRRAVAQRLTAWSFIASLSIGFLLTLLLFPLPGFAGDPWDKPPARWSLAETYKILQDSPWSPAKSRLEVSLFQSRRVDPLTGMPSNLPTAPRDSGARVNLDLGRARPLPPITVLWFSSMTVRLAQERLRQLRNRSATPEALRAEPLADFIVRVEGSEALRMLRAAKDDLPHSVFLEIPGGMSLDPLEIEFHESEHDGLDHVDFHFPRQIAGRPTITPDMDQVVFRCKATARTPQPGQPDTILIRVVFEPGKMRAAGQSDL